LKGGQEKCSERGGSRASVQGVARKVQRERRNKGFGFLKGRERQPRAPQVPRRVIAVVGEQYRGGEESDLIEESEEGEGNDGEKKKKKTVHVKYF
jgi:hypothetical protein